jgi:transcriptional/translational regulatory protein YebC/TACO1
MFLVVLFSGCNMKHCLKVDGNYKGIEGGVEWCFDGVGSKELERPVVTDGKEVFVGISEADAEKINSLIGDDYSTKTKESETNIIKLLKRLK